MIVSGARSRVVVSLADIAGRNDFAGGTKLFVLEIDAIIDHRDDGARAIAQVPGRYHVRMLIHDLSVNAGALQMPLLVKSPAAALPPHQLGMTQLNVFLVQKTLGDGEDLLPGAFGRLDEVGVARVFESALDFEVVALDDLQTGALRNVAVEFYEEVFRIEDGLARAAVGQDTAGEFDGRVFLQDRARVIAKRPGRGLPRHAQNFHARFLETSDEIEFAHDGAGPAGQRRFGENLITGERHSVRRAHDDMGGTFLEIEAAARFAAETKLDHRGTFRSSSLRGCRRGCRLGFAK